MARMQWWMRPGPRRHLADLEAAALAEEHVGSGHAHVVEPDVHVAVRGVVAAEHGHRAQHLDTGGVHRHEDLGLLCVHRRVRVRLAHDDHDLAARVAGAGDVVLLAVEDVLVAVAHRPEPDVLGVRAVGTSGSVMA